LINYRYVNRCGSSDIVAMDEYTGKDRGACQEKYRYIFIIRGGETYLDLI